MYSKYPFTLDIHSAVAQVSIPVTRGDTARRLYIALTDGGVPFRVDDGVRAVLTAEKADGTHLLNDCIIENGGTVIRYDFTEQTASAVGKVACQVKLYGLDGEVLAEPRFSLVVYDGYVSDDVISEDEKTAIDRIFVAEADREAAERAREAAEVDREETARRAEEATQRINDSVRGDRVFIRYAEDENGRNYTEEWRKGLNYIGVYVGIYEPADASGYQWCLLSPGIYVGSGEMPSYADIQIDPSGTIPEDGGGLNGTNCEVISENATAGGNETVAGCKGFRIKNFSPSSVYGGYYTLENYSGGYEKGLPRTGDRVSICITKEDGNEYIYDNIGYIRSIDGNKIYVVHVDEDEKPLIPADDISVLPIDNPVEDQNTLWVVSKPNVGDVDIGVCAMAVGDNTRAIGGYSNAEGRATEAHGKYSHTEGVGTTANFAAHGEGRFSKAKGQHSHSEGYNTEAEGDGAHSEGGNTKAQGARSHSEGNGTTASGSRAHSEGENTKSSGKAAHSEGNGTEASAEAAHSEGVTTKAAARAAHSEGKNSQANGENSHAEGDNTVTGVKARGGHSEGINTQANGLASRASGYNTRADGQMSSAGGDSTIASGARQTVIGKFNAIDPNGTYAFIVGNGTSDSARSNAFAVDWSGNIYLAGVKITPEQIRKLLKLI